MVATTLQEGALYGNFGFCVERNRKQLGLFIDVAAGVSHLSVVTAGGGEDESLNPRPLTFFNQADRCFQIDCACRVRFTRTRWIPDNRRQMDYCLLTRQSGANRVPITDVSSNKFKLRMTPDPEERFTTVSQKIKDTNLVPGGK